MLDRCFTSISVKVVGEGCPKWPLIASCFVSALSFSRAPASSFSSVTTAWSTVYWACSHSVAGARARTMCRAFEGKMLVIVETLETHRWVRPTDCMQEHSLQTGLRRSSSGISSLRRSKNCRCLSRASKFQPVSRENCLVFQAKDCCYLRSAGIATIYFK